MWRQFCSKQMSFSYRFSDIGKATKARLGATSNLFDVRLRGSLVSNRQSVFFEFVISPKQVFDAAFCLFPWSWLSESHTFCFFGFWPFRLPKNGSHFFCLLCVWQAENGTRWLLSNRYTETSSRTKAIWLKVFGLFTHVVTIFGYLEPKIHGKRYICIAKGT